MFDLGLLLRTLREKHGYTQAEASKKLNISTATIGRWENNIVKPSTEKLIESAILYNTPLNYFIGEPLEETLSIEGLSPDKQHIIRAIAAEFRSVTDKGATDKYTEKQQRIMNELFEAFSK